MKSSKLDQIQHSVLHWLQRSKHVGLSFLLGLMLTPSLLHGQEGIAFSDPNLESAIRANLGIDSSRVIDAEVSESFRGNLYLENLNIKFIDELEFFPNADSVFLSGNKIEDIPDLPSYLQWSYLDLSNNKLENLPDFSRLPKLKRLLLGQNHLTFEDLVPLTAVIQVLSSEVLNQRYIELEYQDIEIAEGEDFMLELEIDADVEGGNNYFWYKDGSLLTSLANKTTLVLENISKEDAGTYHCEIKNPALNEVSSVGKLRTTNLELSVYSPLAVPDEKFRACLRDNDLNWFNAQGELISSRILEIEILDCDDYGIQSIEGIEAFPNLKTAWFHNNEIDDLSPLLTLEELERIDFSMNDLSEVPSLQEAVNLEEVNLSNNRISHVGDLNKNPELRVINLFHNELEELPDFSVLTRVDQLSVNCNWLTFEDLLPLANLNNTTGATALSLGNQLKFVGDTIQLPTSYYEGDSIVIALEIDSGISSNTYRWKKGGQFLTETNKNYLSLKDLEIEDAGLYYCEITNDHPLLEGIVIRSFSYNIQVIDCLEPDQLTFEVKDPDCASKGSIQINEEDLDGAPWPIKYELLEVTSYEIFENDAVSPEVTGLEAGTYWLLMTENNGCVTQHPEFVMVEPNFESCDVVITPNSGGVRDEYFIQEIGTAKIYNSSGQLVRELNTPCAWDGTLNNGQISSDQYFIHINDEKVIPVSVVQ